MTTLRLYKYKNGVTTVVTPHEPSGIDYEISSQIRLVADEGMGLTNGEMLVTVIDTFDESAWQEVEAPELWVADEATEADYLEALRNLGVIE